MKNKGFTLPITVIVLASLLLGCSQAGSTGGSAEESAHTTVHWTYEGEEGPANWGELSPDYEACGKGQSQSPINIPPSAPQVTSNLAFHYKTSKINIFNNGHTVQVNYDSGSYIELDKVRYDLVQFHFHAPSEHEINGKLAAAEVHLVHKSADGKLAVVGLLVESGAENQAFISTWQNLPFTKSDVRSLNVSVDAAAMLPPNPATYRYSGSLTTPPCTEGVRWNVVAAPIEMSETQLFVFSTIFEGNNRPVQPLNGRTFTKETAPAAAPAETVHWTYEGEEGPAYWGELSPDYAACSKGKAQSPINISSANTKNLENLVFHYQPSQINILNNGHTVQVNYDPGSYIELDKVRYDLVQFHFHAPSEHAVDGRLADAEMHLVHKSAAGKLAVVGILIKVGLGNPAFSTTWANLPATSGPVKNLLAVVDAAAMLPYSAQTYRYSGSLTTPPCTEGVRWNVMVEPIEISRLQLEAFTAIFEGNNRPLQDLNDRTLLLDSTP